MNTNTTGFRWFYRYILHAVDIYAGDDSVNLHAQTTTAPHNLGNVSLQQEA